MLTPTSAHQHQHHEYAHHDGLFVCQCGSVRTAPGVWADPDTSQRIRRAAKQQSDRLRQQYGTTVDAYGQRLPEKKKARSC